MIDIFRMFAMVVERLLLVECKKITEPIERKVVAAGLARLVSDQKQIFLGPYFSVWYVEVYSIC